MKSVEVGDAESQLKNSLFELINLKLIQETTGLAS
jgi:hypothetical protein